MDSDSEGERYADTVLEWIHAHVDDAVPSSCIEIMLLGVRTELDQDDRDGVREPSGLYCALRKKAIYGEEELLARFIYALELLNRGTVNAAITRLPDGLNDYRPFDPSSPKISRNFRFHQALVKVCIRMRDVHSNDRKNVISQCTRLCTIAGTTMTSKLFKTVVSLICRLLEKGLITDEDQMALAKGLVAGHEIDCFRIIQQYRLENNLHQMDMEKINDDIELAFQNAPPNWKTENTESPNDYPLKFTARNTSTPTSSYASRVSSSIEGSVTSNNTNPTTENTTVQKERRIGRRNSVPASNPSGRPPETKVCCRKSTMCAITLIVFAIIVGLLVVITFATLTTISNYVVNGNHTRDYYDNSVVILSEVSHFFTKRLVVDRPDNDTREIDLYQFDESCSNLPFEQNQVIFNKSITGLSDLNETVLYLYPHTSFNLTICTDTYSSTSISIFLLNNLKLFQNSSISKQEVTKKLFSKMTFNFKNDKCEIFNQTIPSGGRNYYVLLIYTNPSFNDSQGLNFNSSLTVKGPILNINLTPTVWNKYTLENTLSFIFSFSFSKSCIIADIKSQGDKNGTQKLGHLNLNFEPYKVWVKHTGFSVSGGMVLVGVCFLFVVCVCVCRKRYQGRRRRSGSRVYVRVKETPPSAPTNHCY